MAILEVKLIPDPILRGETKVVTKFDRQLHTFLDDMFETMEVSHGLGIAAPQVGSLDRIAIMDLSIRGVLEPTVTSLSDQDPSTHIYKDRLEMINPKILSANQVVSSHEGCISIPDYRDSIKRFNKVTMTAHDRFGNLFQVEAEKLTAICIQHEVDHLEGILFVDHLSRLKKQLFNRWCAKRRIQFEDRK